MARIFPERLETGPASERRVHGVLCNLPDDYMVVHGARWLGSPDKGGRVRDGEADFVISRADRGILVLEVKGGAIDFDPTTGNWTSTSRSGEKNRIKDPFDQAVTSKHLLIEKLRCHERWPRERVKFCHAVCFPDVSIKDGLGLSAPRNVVLDANDLDDIESSLDRVFSFFDDGQRPGNVAIKVVRQVLAPNLHLRRSLGSQIRSENREIREHTAEQAQVLKLLHNQRRAVISGCAGSGKTYLAMEKARQLSGNGLRVLLLCYNARLAKELSRRAQDYTGITAVNFHSLAIRLIEKAGVELEWDTEHPEFWEKTVPEKLVDAVAELPERFDALIIDEGQDFAASWWDPLQWLLVDEQNGIFYVFMDDNQKLYDRRSEIPIDTKPFPLTRNCRNTEHISKFVNSYYQGDTRPICGGPPGRNVELRTCTTPEQLRFSVEQRLSRLVSKEGVAPHDIIVLTAHGAPNSELRGLEGDGFKLEATSKGNNTIELESIYRYKGLEKPVVVLTELGGVAPEKIDSLMYVGSSRALNHLIVFAPAELEIPMVGA